MNPLNEIIQSVRCNAPREAPNNARTEGFSFLVRAGYLTRENDLTPLGEHTIKHLRELQSKLSDSFFQKIGLLIIGNEEEAFFPIKAGLIDVIHCSSCKYTERLELARFTKSVFHQEEQLPLEKVLTPNCNTIESLAIFLSVPKAKTAKALMFTRVADNKFIFVVVRGDMQLSETKLKKLVGDIRPATAEEISRAGASAGYASPIGLKDVLIVVDDLILQSNNLIAGANELGYHFKNTNYGSEYTADIVSDIVQAQEGDLALAETYHDETGLTLPKPAAPFDVYLMNIAGKEMDTRAKAEEIYITFQNASISVLFDDRDERAGVKFNDADLIGCPVRVTVGEKNLKEGMVELKPRKEQENRRVFFDKVVEEVKMYSAEHTKKEI